MLFKAGVKKKLDKEWLGKKNGVPVFLCNVSVVDRHGVELKMGLQRCTGSLVLILCVAGVGCCYNVSTVGGLCVAVGLFSWNGQMEETELVKDLTMGDFAYAGVCFVMYSHTSLVFLVICVATRILE
jgi:hypothetical protein